MVTVVARSEDFADEASKAPGLSDHDKAVLDFAGKRYNYKGMQEQHIIEQFGVSPTRYFQDLHRLVSPENPMTAHSEAYAPMTVHRYQRILESKRASRAARYQNGS